ncbi:MAG: UvrD-helicase domain-containing protein [Verrucomicrobiota bacterium]
MPDQSFSRHLMIRASAGSGKTWQLSNRIVQLLMMGFPVARLVALTFTRNAAGEFFDAVLKKLAQAASSDECASVLNNNIGLDPKTPAARYRDVLLSLLYALHEIRFGTLDSFFYRVVSAYTLELGLPAQVQLMGSHDALLHRQQVLESILDPKHPSSHAFIEAFDQATWGAEEKNLDSLLGNFIDSQFTAYERFRETKLEWPPVLTDLAKGSPKIDSTQLKAELRTALAQAGLSDKSLAKWDECVDTLLTWQPKQTLFSPTKTFFANIMKGYLPADRACPHLTIDRKKLSLNEEGSKAFGLLCERWISRSLTRSFQQSQGIIQLQRLYQCAGRENALRTGRIDYKDLTRLLNRLPTEKRQAIEFRIDQQLDHWLLDEFQDTSREQWKGISSLVEEVLQDPEGDRSFFCVGDSKQSLYGWRGGDSRLFDEILDRFAKTMDTRQLDSTWRCSPPVISMINEVFTHNPLLDEKAPEVADRWNHLWNEHRAEKEFPGYAAIYDVPDPKSADENSPTVTEAIVELLQNITPLEHGLSCAILTPRNQDAHSFADAIQETLHWPVIVEGVVSVARDNPYGLVLLAATRMLSHPGDTLASGWLKGLQPNGFNHDDLWRTNSFQKFSLEGSSAWAHSIWEQFLPGLDGHQTRKRQLVQALNQFDQQESRDPHALESFLENLEVRSSDSSGAIQCMTIHASKGLGFDVVILASLDSGTQGILQRRRGPLIAEREDRSVAWVLETPDRAMIDAVPELAHHYDREVNDNAFEKWCQLYVAMTRAKAGLYLFTEPRDSANALRLSNLAAAPFTREEPAHFLDLSSPRASYGNPNWFSSRQPAPEEQPKNFPRSFSFKEPTRTSLQSHPNPSSHVHHLFAASPEFGVRLHELAALLDQDKLQSNITRLEDLNNSDPLSQEACQALLKLLQSKISSQIFNISERTTLWIEKPFAWHSPNGLIKGRWDRVHLETDSTGSPVKATLYDFKTNDDTEHLRDHYQEQIENYRDALSAVTHLPTRQIEAYLIHIRSCKLIDMG